MDGAHGRQTKTHRGRRASRRQFKDPPRPAVHEDPSRPQQRHPANPPGGVYRNHHHFLAHAPAVDGAAGQQQPAAPGSGTEAAPSLPVGARHQQGAGPPPGPGHLHDGGMVLQGWYPPDPHGQGEAPQAGCPQEQGQPRASSQRRSRLADRFDAPSRPPHPHRRGFLRAREAPRASGTAVADPEIRTDRPTPAAEAEEAAPLPTAPLRQGPACPGAASGRSRETPPGSSGRPPGGRGWSPGRRCRPR